MKKMIAIIGLLFSCSTFANQTALEYDNSFKKLKESVDLIYHDVHLGMLNSAILDQLSTILSAFNDYQEVAIQIQSKFKDNDVQLFADLAKLNPQYCKIEAVEDNTFALLAIASPAYAPLAILDDAEVKFRLNNFTDLIDLRKQIIKEEYKTKLDKSNVKRFIRKLNKLRAALVFEE